MFKRQRTGSVICASCGSLVGVNDDKCYSCGRRNPGLWGYGRALRELGSDLGLVTLILYACVALYLLELFSCRLGLAASRCSRPCPCSGRTGSRC